MGGSTAFGQMTEQQALGSFYYGAREYNLITFGDYTAAASDTWGAVAVGGVFHDLSDGITFGQESLCLPTNSIRSSVTDPVAIIRGGIELLNNAKPKTPLGTLAVSPTIQAAGSGNNATNFLSSTRFFPGKEQGDGKTGYFECTKGLASWDLASSVVAFDALSTRLGQANATFSAKSPSTSGVTKSTVNDGSSVLKSSIAVTAPGISFVDVNVGEYAGKKLDLSIPEDSFLVVNLHVGATNVFNPKEITLGGVDWSSGRPVGTAANRILWNVVFDGSGSPSSNSLVIGVEDHDFFGSILAPNGTVDGTGARVWGQIIANAYTQSSNFEIHQALMEVNMTMVPEPSTIALGMGALALGFVYWRRRQQRQQQQS